MNNPFDDAAIIFKYTRQQALDDGVLIDISEIAKEAGIKYPVAVTQGVYQVLNDTQVLGQDFKGRTWDMLMIFRLSIKAAGGDVSHFAPLFLLQAEKQPEPVQMWAKCGPGDDMSPVITIMLEGED